MTNIVIVGSGYVGLTTGSCLALLGNVVTCVDSDSERVKSLRNGRIPFFEEGIDGLVRDGVTQGRLSFTDDLEASISQAEMVFLCLPTPELPDGSADLSSVRAVLTTITRLVAKDAIIVYKSTIPINSLRLLKAWLSRSDVHFVSNPEFLREGSAVHDFLHPERIVIGGEDNHAMQRVCELYASLGGERILTDNTSAETIKYVSNAYLAMKISFVNEVSRFCGAVGANIGDVISGLASDSRMGSSHFSPGPGWGGSCFPKDTKALLHMSESSGFDFNLVRATIQSNDAHMVHIASRIVQVLAHMERQDDARVSILGLTFKAHTDDIRFSPALRIATLLRQHVHYLSGYDPLFQKSLKEFDIVSDDLYQALTGTDLAVVTTEWPEFKTLDAARARKLMRGDVFFDTRNVLDQTALSESGLRVLMVSSRL